jgi:hypothetical protein
LENLKTCTLWLSAPDAFNDPFDCAVDVVLKELDDADIVRVFEFINQDTSMTDDLKAKLAIHGAPSPQHRQIVERSIGADAMRPKIEMLRGLYGIACLSAKNDDLLMWSHYADGHRGFCLEFDTSSAPFDKAEPVVYRDAIPEVNVVDILDGNTTGPSLVEVAYRTKYTCWSYEAEWRLVHGRENVTCTYPAEALTGVYLGASMPEGQKELVCQLLLGSSAQIYEMHRGDGGFTVEPSVRARA